MASPSVSAKIQINVISGLLALPRHSVIDGNLNAEGHGDLVRLPAHLTVQGDLGLRGTSLKHLPAKLRVLGNVDLEGCESLVSIKKGLVVEGNLDLEGCSFLSKIADDIYVGGNLFMHGTNFAHLPKNVVVKGQIYDLATRQSTGDEGEGVPRRPRRKHLQHRHMDHS